MNLSLVNPRGLGVCLLMLSDDASLKSCPLLEYQIPRLSESVTNNVAVVAVNDITISRHAPNQRQATAWPSLPSIKTVNMPINNIKMSEIPLEAMSP